MVGTVALSSVVWMQRPSEARREISDLLVGGRFNSADHVEQTSLATVLTDQIAQKGEKNELGNNPKRNLLDLSPTLTSKDFSPRMKAALEYEYEIERGEENMLLAGMAGVRSIERDIVRYARERIENPQAGMFYGTLPWAANLVRARRGNAESLQKILEAARKADVHTQIVFLLQDLAYVPQPEVVRYMAGFVFSGDRLEPIDSNFAPPHAVYAAAALSRMLIGCPVPYKEDYSYTLEEIDLLRNWLETTKTFEFKSDGQ